MRIVHGQVRAVLRQRMPLILVLPHSSQRIRIRANQACIVGRNELRECPERMFVSRRQCTLHLQPDGRQAQLVHTGSGNPTLVIRAEQQHEILKPGGAALLSPGDSFCLVATKLQDAIQLIWVNGAEQQQQQQKGDKHGQHSQYAGQQQTEPAGQQQLQQGVAHQQVAATNLPHQLQEVACRTGNSLQQQYWQHQPNKQWQRQQATTSASTAGTGTAAPASASSAQQGTSSGPASDAAHMQQAAHQSADAGLDAAAAAGDSQSVMLLLVGVPGSGKSTFAAALAQRSSYVWVRVNQDSIRGGKKGTRQQCIAAARATLARGYNVIVDRCNIDAPQRASFSSLAAALHTPIHCLVLDLTSKLCVDRVRKRVNHEGGVEGQNAVRVVYQMAGAMKKAGPIAASEGFVSLTTCTSEKQVAAALDHWAAAAAGRLKSAAAEVSAAAVLAAAATPQTKRQKTAESATAGATGTAAIAPYAAGQQQRSQQQQSPQQQKQLRHQNKALVLLQQEQQQQSQHVSTPCAADAGLGSNIHINAFQKLLQGAKQQQQQQQQEQSVAREGHVSAKTGAAIAGTGPPGRHGAANASPAGSNRGTWPSWSSELSDIAAAPDRFRAVQTIWHIDNQVVGVLDKFPKARHHALLIARQQGLHRVSQLIPEHLPLLRHMQQVADRWTQSLAPVKAGWRIGFHSIPSMAQLHLHIISNDFDSQSLKVKKHWNSFTSGFFFHLTDVIVSLEAGHTVQVDVAATEQLLKQPMQCHVCQQQLKTIPQLKAHLKTHADIFH